MGRRKGAVHPSSPRPPPLTLLRSSVNAFKSPEAVLKLLPETIMAVAMSLPVQDREVLAYLLARSMSIGPTAASAARHDQRSSSAVNTCKKGRGRGKEPAFGCGCFNCYTRFWCRWDSSPNREIIHQAIEEFEEHLVASESAGRRWSSGGGGRGKKKVSAADSFAGNEKGGVALPPREVVETESQQGDLQDLEESCGEVGGEGGEGNVAGDGGSGGAGGQKCLVRKMLSEVVGFFQWRIWKWSWRQKTSEHVLVDGSVKNKAIGS